MKPIFVFLCIIALNTAETFRGSKKVFSNSGSSHLNKIFIHAEDYGDKVKMSLAPLPVGSISLNLQAHFHRILAVSHLAVTVPLLLLRRPIPKHHR